MNLKAKKERFFSTAHTIGKHICQQAYWKESRCNWMGKTVDNPFFGSDEYTNICNKALGPELYNGTSGIALFLSYLYVSKKLEQYLQTSEGAINHAIMHVTDIPSNRLLGFYNGYMGISYTAIKIGLILHNDVLIEKGITIFNKLISKKENEHLMDIISGNAGTILAALEIYDLLQEQEYYDFALSLGNELIKTAIKNKKGWSWNYRANGVRSIHNLTGFSHGTAGIGCSLLELFHRTDNKKISTCCRKSICL